MVALAGLLHFPFWFRAVEDCIVFAALLAARNVERREEAEALWATIERKNLGRCEKGMAGDATIDKLAFSPLSLSNASSLSFPFSIKTGANFAARET